MDAKYKCSMYNYMVDDLSQIILFNSYSGRIICSKKCNIIKDLLNGNGCTDKELERSMIANGFLVPEDENEAAR